MARFAALRSEGEPGADDDRAPVPPPLPDMPLPSVLWLDGRLICATVSAPPPSKSPSGACGCQACHSANLSGLAASFR